MEVNLFVGSSISLVFGLSTHFAFFALNEKYTCV